MILLVRLCNPPDRHHLADYDGTSGALQNRYIFGAGMDEPLIQVSSSGTLTFYHANEQGSVMGVTNSSGAIANKNVYGPLGETGALTGTIFGFTGQRFDAEAGLYYYKNRYYSPLIGRFLQPDPIGYSKDFNLYTYAGNNPLSRKDPLGLEWYYASGAVQVIPGSSLDLTPTGMKTGWTKNQAITYLKTVAKLASLTIALNAFLQTRAVQLYGNNPDTGAMGEELVGEFLSNLLGNDAMISNTPKQSVNMAGITLPSVMDFSYNYANGPAIGEVKSSVNNMPSLINLTWPQAGAALAIAGGIRGTTPALPNPTLFVEYDIFEIKFTPIGSLPCIAGLGG